MNNTITQLSYNFYQIKLNVFIILFLGALVVIATLHFFKMQTSAAVVKTWRNM